MNFVALRMLTGDSRQVSGADFRHRLLHLSAGEPNVDFREHSQAHRQSDSRCDRCGCMGDGCERPNISSKPRRLKDTDLTRVRGVSGVEWAVKLFKGAPVARTRAGKFATCILLGLDDATLTGAPRKMLLGSWQRLQEPDSIVIDNAGYILLFPGEPLELDRELEMNDHK